MAIDFPDSPTTGDTHTVGDKTWTYDGTAWNVVQNNVADHGNLGGLADDDHTQYLLADGTRTATELTVTNDLTVDTDTLHVDSTNNRVGIGTTSPGRPLHVYDSTLDLPLRVASGDSRAGIEFFDNATTVNLDISAVGDSLRMRTNGSDRFTIDSSGNVGINDTTPSYKLDVNGDINATGDVRVAGAPVGKVLVYEGSVGSGVSSFTASNVFSSAYDNYEVIVSGMDCSIDGVVLGLRLGSSTTAYNYGGYYIIYSTGGSGFFGSAGVESSWGVGYTDTRGVTGFVAQILCPNLAIRTKFTSVSPGNNVQRSVAGEHSSNTAHTSFTLLPSSGTMTGGVVRVYGHVEA